MNFKIKAGSLTIATSMLVSIIPTYANTTTSTIHSITQEATSADKKIVSKIPLTDIANHWAKSEIQAAVQAGYVSGFPDHTFKPDAPVTRAQFMKMLAVALKLPSPAQTAGEAWYQPDVDALVKAGIHHNDFTNYTVHITRLEMMRLAIRALEPSLRTQQTPDAQLVLDCVKKGIITGVGKGELDLEGSSTRAQAVTITERVLHTEQRKVDATAVQTATASVKTGDQFLLDSKHASTQTFTVKDGKLVFSPTGEPNASLKYHLNSVVNPYINEQVYAAAKVISGKKYYTVLWRKPASGGAGSNVSLQYYYANQGTAPDPNSAFFIFNFDESAPYNAQKDWKYNPFSTSAVISLDVSHLFVGSQYPTTPYLVNKLKESLIAIFGQNTGGKIADYVYGKYLIDINYFHKYHQTQSVKEVKTCNNIEIDYVDDKGSQSFYFSYVK